MQEIKNSAYKNQRRGQIILGIVMIIVTFVAIAGIINSAIQASTVVKPLDRPANTLVSNQLIAYSVDFDMDKARLEKTIEHYGEPVRGIVEQAVENNDENPEHKDTAENSYKRENSVIDNLPKENGRSFSKEDLVDMEHSDKAQEK
jgi:hypothetical protein